MNVLVTGATGFIGKHLIPSLLEKSFSVHALARPTSRRPASFSDRVTWCEGNLSNPDSLKKACRNMDTVIHLAGIVKAGKAAEYFAVNYEGTQNLLKAAAPSVRLILISSQAAVGPTTAAHPLDEEAPPRPVSAYGRSKLAAEKAVIESDKSIRYTIIRPPVVYGPEDRESLSIFKLARYHLRPQIGFGKSFVNAIYVKDLVAFILACLQEPRAERQIFHINDGIDNGYSYHELIQTAAEVLQTWTAPVFIPKIVLKGLAVINAFIADLFGRTSMFNPDKYHELTAPAWLLSAQKARRIVGFRAENSLSEGFTKTIRWYLSKGWLR
ncbi:MAG: hypothetical protein DRP96_01410 [Candidatus Neomarinimicrobiota bacterium]|nr:MAG: hypothetical protein DRP96_01410 [Candidatus Neomarinimicrobiota bacterium]